MRRSIADFVFYVHTVFVDNSEGGGGHLFPLSEQTFGSRNHTTLSNLTERRKRDFAKKGKESVFACI
jgi:hypothetical protein